MNWSPIQARALDEVARWLNDPYGEQVFYLAGYAGTGKTTLAQYFASGVKGLVLFAAFTGKAASVLRRRGCPTASTLHSIIYSVSDADLTTLRELQRALAALPPDASPLERQYLEEELGKEKRKAKQPRFSRNPDSVLKDASLLVLDECSMINKPLGLDTLSFGKKVLVLGDPAQLPPVHGGGFFTSRDPDILLTEIHRQAADNPIIRWSKVVREGGTLPFGEEGSCLKVRKGDVSRSWIAREAGQLLTGMNATRRVLNRNVRREMDYFSRSYYPRKGERLVVLRNDHELGILNGVTCEAAEDAIVNEYDESTIIMSLDYEGRIIEDLPVQKECFLAAVDPEYEDYVVDRNMVQLDYGYALTVHKAQGSQWPTVTIADDGFMERRPRDRRRWLYTAITRAEERLNIVA